MTIRILLCTLTVAIITLTATSASAQITVDGSDFWKSSGSPVLGNFDASGSDKLVVIATGEHGFNQTHNGQINDITYDGVSLTKLVDRNPIADEVGPPAILVDDTANDIWYLDNPATSTGLISVDATTRASVTVIALSGTAAGAGNTAIGARDTSSADLTTSADSIVIASYGMGGAGNTAFINNVTVDAPLTFVSKQNNGGGRWWDGHVTAYANEVAAGSATYSMTDTSTPQLDGRTGSHLILAEFLVGTPPALLTLQVNTLTGNMALLGDETEAIDFSYYEITSGDDSLDATNWTSITSQGLPGFPVGDGSGNGWEEAGGVGKHALAEAYLKGDSTVNAGARISLGMGYDESVGDTNLFFTYKTNKIQEGNIEYVSYNPDINGDGAVDSDDLNLVLADYDPLETDLDGLAPYSPADLDLVLSNFGRTDLGGAATAEVPEPGAMVLLLFGMLGLLVVRRRR